MDPLNGSKLQGLILALILDLGNLPHLVCGNWADAMGFDQCSPQRVCALMYHNERDEGYLRARIDGS